MRKAAKEDIKDIMQIIKETIEEMRSYSNTQWDENYPKEEDFTSDIEKGELFVVDRDGKLAGFVCINKIEPAEYGGLSWSFNGAAMVVHRMAVNPNYRRSGVGTELMKFADDFALKNNIKHLKIDTYSINAKMNDLIVKCNYNFVGEIYLLGREKPFFCYEKILNL